MGMPQSELLVPNIPELTVLATAPKLELMVHDTDSDGRQGFSRRLNEALRDADYPPHGAAARLGAEMGVSGKAAGKWINAQSIPDTKRLDALSLLLSVRAEWLLTGRGEKIQEAGGLPVGDNVMAGPAVRGSVPVISWVAAGTWNEAVDTLHPGDAEEWAPCIASHGPRAYALRVRGDSMTAPHGKSYPDGCLIFVDPDRCDPPSGTPIIAKVNGDDAVTFKLVVKDAGRIWLRALNPAYPPIMDHFRVLGTVIGKWEDA